MINRLPDELNDELRDFVKGNLPLSGEPATIEQVTPLVLAAHDKLERAHRARVGEALKVLIPEVLGRLSANFGSLPDTYVCIDIETSGVRTRQSKILQIGHCVVVDRKVVDRDSFYLDWTKSTDRTGMTEATLKELQSEIAATGAAIRSGGKAFHTDWSKLLVEGQDPYQVIRDYARWVLEMKDEKTFMLMHNGYSFDCQFLSMAFSKLAADMAPKFALPMFVKGGGTDYSHLDAFWFPDNAVLDTGIILKASQSERLPLPGETLRAFSKRVSREVRRGLYWSLNEFAVPFFKLAEKYDLSAEKAHDAGYDTFVCHCLFEEMRGIYENATTQVAAN